MVVNDVFFRQKRATNSQSKLDLVQEIDFRLHTADQALVHLLPHLTRLFDRSGVSKHALGIHEFRTTRNNPLVLFLLSRLLQLLTATIIAHFPLYRASKRLPLFHVVLLICILRFVVFD